MPDDIPDPDEPGGTTALDLWRKKLAFFEEQEAIEADPEKKFGLRLKIREAREKVDTLSQQAPVFAAKPKRGPWIPRRWGRPAAYGPGRGGGLDDQMRSLRHSGGVMHKPRWMTEKVLIAIIIGLIGTISAPLIVTYFGNNPQPSHISDAPTTISYKLAPAQSTITAKDQWIIYLGRGLGNTTIATNTLQAIKTDRPLIGKISAKAPANITAGLAFLMTNNASFVPIEAWAKDGELEIRIPKTDSAHRLLVLLQISGLTDPNQPPRLHELEVEAN